MNESRILVPTDFTDAGNLAFRTAAEYTSQYGGVVTPLYVYEENREVAELLGETFYEMKSETADIIHGKLRSAALHHIEESRLSESLIISNKPAQGIVEAAKDFDLVIMGTNARTGLDRIMHSSVVKKVISVSSRPVIIATEKSSIKPLERVLLLTDLSKNSTQAFMDLRYFMERSNFTVDLVYFVQVGPFTVGNNNTNVEKAKNELETLKRRFFKGLEYRVKTEALITSVSASEAITNLTFSREYNLLFLSTLGQSSLSNLMLGSTAATVVRTVDCAVYVVNPKEYR